MSVNYSRGSSSSSSSNSSRILVVSLMILELSTCLNHGGVSAFSTFGRGSIVSSSSASSVSSWTKLNQQAGEMSSDTASMASSASSSTAVNGENVNGSSSSSSEVLAPKTFREAELIGLRLMQEAKYEDAIAAFKKGMALPGSKKDVIRKQSLAGPSPVGGAAGGREGGVVMILDEFEYQAAHYNIACAYSKLDRIPDAVVSLGKAIDYGFNNLDTMKADPDLRSIQGSPEFQVLMKKHETKSFNP